MAAAADKGKVAEPVVRDVTVIESSDDVPKPAKPVPGFVTFKHPDGSTTTNAVDDIANIPPHKFDDVDPHGKVVGGVTGEIVEIKPKG